MEVLKVSSKSKPNSVAGALANAFREKQTVEIQAVGAGSDHLARAGTRVSDKADGQPLQESAFGGKAVRAGAAGRA